MKHTLLIIITFLYSVLSFATTNYSQEWEKVDDLMDKSALNDAFQAVQKINETAKRENNTHQLLLAEIYSYAIELGCDYSLHEREKLLTPPNFDIQEGMLIIDKHYTNARALLSQLSDKGEIALCQHYLLHLISEYQKTNYSFNQSVVKDAVPAKQLKKMTIHEINRAQMELIDSLFVSLEALNKLPSQNYSDLLIFSDGNGETMADIIAQGLFKSARAIPYQRTPFSDVKMPTMTELSSQPEEPYTTAENYGEPYFKHIICEKLIRLSLQRRDTNKCIQYDIKRIENFLNGHNFSKLNKPQKEDLAIKALENICEAFPNDSAIIKAEALRAKLIRVKADTTNLQIESLRNRLLSVKERFKDTHSLYLIDEQLDFFDQHKFQCHIKDIFHSNEPIKIYISHSNVKKVIVTIKGTTSVNGTKVAFPEKECEFSLKPSNYFISKEDSIQLENLPYGDYTVKVRDIECKVPQKDEKPLCFIVSDIATISTIPQCWWEDFVEEDMNFKTWRKAIVASMSRFFYEVYAVDNISGKPIKGVNYSGLVFSKSTTDKNGKAKLFSTEKLGPMRLPIEDGDEFRAEKGDDRFNEGDVTIEEMDNNYNERKTITVVNTDRAVYRPGQKVKFFGFCYRIDPKKQKEIICPSKPITVQITHKGNTIEKIELATDNFGKFHGEYSIAKNDEAIGSYSIKATTRSDNKVETYSSYINVEAYKLQQMEVVFDYPNGECTLTKEVPISGTVKYLSGEAISNAKVLLKVDNKKYTLTTDSTGKFSATYDIHPDALNKKEKQLSISASITAPSGETLEKNSTLILFKNNVFIELYSDSLVDLSNNPHFSLLFIRKYSNGGHSLSYEAQRIERRVKIQLKPTQKKGKTFEWEETLDGHTTVSLPKDLCQEAYIGTYKLTITDPTTGDTLNRKTSSTHFNSYDYWFNSENDIITLYDSRSKVSPTNQMLWINKHGHYYLSPQGQLQFSIATNQDSLYVLYRVADHNNVTIKEEWIVLNKELKTIAIPYNEMFSKKKTQGYVITVSALKNHQFCNKYFSIEKTRENKNLQTKITSFRDKIESGTHQKWTIEVSGTKKPVSLVASMTDMALDKHKSNYWSSNCPRYVLPFITRMNSYRSEYGEGLQSTWETDLSHSSYTQWIPTYSKYEEGLTFAYPLWSLTSKSFVKRRNSKPLPPLKKYTLEDFKDGYWVKGTVRDDVAELPGANITITGTDIGTVSDMDGDFEILVPKNGCELDISFIGYVTERLQITGPQELDVLLFPDQENEEVVVVGYGVQKKSDLTGSVTHIRGVSSISGATPVQSFPQDSNNDKIRENFTETAFFYPDLHTKDGKATIEFEAPESLTMWEIKLFALSKEMQIGVNQYVVQTTKPFTIRPYVPRVFRSGDRNVISATIASHEGLAITGKATILLEDEKSGKEIGNRTIDFNIAAHQNDTINCSFDVPEGIESIKMTVTAENDNHKDGEIHSIPVVANCSRTIKAQNAMIRKGETKTLTVKTDKSDDVQLTVEYTANSFWQAVMSLPSVAEPQYDNAIDLASAYYTNAIISHINKTYPTISNAIKDWGCDSKLKQNNELKGIVLEATPWKAEAQNETEQREAVTYMLQNAENKMGNALSRLRSLQNSDYGYAWFPNGKSSPWTTLYVCQQMAKLHQKGLLDKSGETEFKKALQYIDKCIEVRLAHYNSEMINNRGIAANEYEIRLMWLRHYTQDLEPLSEKAKLATAACYKETKENWKQLTLYGKSCFAQLLLAKRDTALAKTIVEALRQSYTRSSSEGIYWKENHNSCSWHNTAVSVHAEAMRAFIQTGLATEDELAEMQLWLLRKKETGVWRSTTETIDAIDVLLQSSALEGEGGIVTLPNGEQINASSGYVKRTMKGNPSKNSIKVEGPSRSIGFAALYATQEMTNSDITAVSNHISVTKKSYSVELEKDKNGQMTEVLKELKEGEKIFLGSKIKIRLTVESDQDLDYVLVKDERASCMEPGKVISQYVWDNQTYYYRNYTDTSYRMFFNQLRKGTYIFDYTLHATTNGSYSAGIATAECLYSPSFRGNSDNGVRINVGE